MTVAGARPSGRSAARRIAGSLPPRVPARSSDDIRGPLSTKKQRKQQPARTAAYTRRSSGLARCQLNDRDDTSSLPGLLTKVGVLRVDAVSKLPESLPLGVVFHDFGAERQAAEHDVGMLAEVVVPGWGLRPPPH